MEWWRFKLEGISTERTDEVRVIQKKKTEQALNSEEDLECVAEYKGAVREERPTHHSMGHLEGTCFGILTGKKDGASEGGGRGDSLRAQEDQVPVKTERRFLLGLGEGQCKQKDKAKNSDDLR